MRPLSARMPMRVPLVSQERVAAGKFSSSRTTRNIRMTTMPATMQRMPRKRPLLEPSQPMRPELGRSFILWNFLCRSRAERPTFWPITNVTAAAIKLRTTSNAPLINRVPRQAAGRLGGRRDPRGRNCAPDGLLMITIITGNRRQSDNGCPLQLLWSPRDDALD
jgi:hypothetical protein